jgi:D-alanine-D-alanine ligase-like ATP-grasp enzyme
VAVVCGGDAQRSYRADASAAVVIEALSDIDRQPVVVELGMNTAQALVDSGAQLVIDATLDARVADGGVLEICGALGLAYAGAGPGTRRACADKAICSASLAHAGVLVPPQRALSRGALYMLGAGIALPKIAAGLGSQYVIKPRHGDAGLGVRMVYDVDGLPGAVQSAFIYDEAIVIERLVSGRECSVLLSGSEGELWAVGIADVFYEDGAQAARSAAWARSYAPIAPISTDRLQAVTAAARRAAHALGCRGLAKVDVVIDEEGAVWVFDVDCAIDWSPSGCLAACLASNDVTESQLMATLLGQVPIRRQAA